VIFRKIAAGLERFDILVNAAELARGNGRVKAIETSLDAAD
jgi:hypothetical protein